MIMAVEGSEKEKGGIEQAKGKGKSKGEKESDKEKKAKEKETKKVAATN